MTDPLLTSLCTICHIQTPKYKCPRCATRTCSLQCISKHKKWSSCSGERDPTVYMPPSKLKTDAGIDHDYNFLTKIERSIETAEKTMREERDILPPPGQGPAAAAAGQHQHQHQQQHPNKRARFNDGGNGSRHFQNPHHEDPPQQGGGIAMAPSRRWDKASHFRLRKLGIHVAAVPYGMTRSRENKTSWNKRTRTINWQVEWFVHGDGDAIAEEKRGDKMETETEAAVVGKQQQRPTRIMYKILDETPLAQGFEASRESFRHAQMTDAERLAEKSGKKGKEDPARDPATQTSPHKATYPGQDPTTSSWATACVAAVQLPTTTAWRTPPTPVTGRSNGQNNQETKPVTESEYKFFYQRPRVPSRQNQKLVPLDAADGLAKILPGLEIVEFPTIHVFPKAMALPAGYVVDEAPKHREMPTRARQRRRSQADDGGGEQVKNENGKRKAAGIVGYASSDDEEDDDNDSGPEELGLVEGVAQGGVDDPADTTSSSGSSDEDDSDEDMAE